jgi:hypothetical protein
LADILNHRNAKKEKMQKRSLIIFIILTSISSFGQQSADKFLIELRQQKIDTICQFDDYSVGYYRVFNENDKKDYCDFEPTYIFWKDNGKTFLTKKDSCFEYLIIEVEADKIWRIYFDNKKLIQNEKVKEFQFIEMQNGKKNIQTIIIDHSHHQNFKFIIKNEIVEKKFDDFDIQNSNEDRNERLININYEHNLNLKSKKLIDEINALILENEKLLLRK